MRLSRMNPYEKLIARKRKWSPVQMEAGKLKEGAEELIQPPSPSHRNFLSDNFIFEMVLKKAFPMQHVNYWR